MSETSQLFVVNHNQLRAMKAKLTTGLLASVFFCLINLQAAEPSTVLKGTKRGNRQAVRLQPGGPSITKDPLRFGNHDGAAILSRGGDEETEKAVQRALDWFTKKQLADGHWEETQSPIAHTGLVMMCYMAYGAVPGKDGPYREQLDKAVAWLLKRVGPEGELRDGGRMYDQSIGTLALSEAYGLSKDERLKEPVKKAVAYLCKAQNPETGGWRYAPYHETSSAGDLSVSGWVIMALASAQMAGLDVPQTIRLKGLGFLDRVCAGGEQGLYGYMNKLPTPSMTAEGMYSVELFSGAAPTKRLDESAAYLMTHLPDKKQESYYYWYYGTLALRLYSDSPEGAKAWEEWNSRMKPLLLSEQKEDGHWAAVGWRAKEDGDIATTAWATLMLEVYYRYLPLYGRAPALAKLGGTQRGGTRPTAGRPQ